MLHAGCRAVGQKRLPRPALREKLPYLVLFQREGPSQGEFPAGLAMSIGLIDMQLILVSAIQYLRVAYVQWSFRQEITVFSCQFSSR